MKTLQLRGIIGTDIRDQMVSSFLEKMKGEDIEVRIHSFGGSVFEGNLIYNSFKNYSGTKSLIIEGVCASMGSIIMGSFDKISIVKNGFLMIHTPSGATEGNASAHESNAKVLRLMEKNFKEVYGQRTDYDLNKLMDGNDHWFDAEEALKHGFVDEVIESKAQFEIDIADAKTKDSFQKFIASSKGNIPLEFKETSKAKPSKHIKSNTMKNKIAALLIGYGTSINAEATDEEFYHSVKAKFEEKDKKILELEGKIKEQTKASKKAVLDNALAVQQIDKEQHKNLSEIAEQLKTAEDVNKLLAGITKPISISSIVKANMQHENGEAIRMNWDWDTYQDKDPNALDRMREENPEHYAALEKAKFG